MARKISPNKISDRDQRQIENVRSRLRKKGVGEEESTRRATEKVAEKGLSGRGGGRQSGGEPQRPTDPTSRKRTGSRDKKSG